MKGYEKGDFVNFYEDKIEGHLNKKGFLQNNEEDYNREMKISKADKVNGKKIY